MGQIVLEQIYDGSADSGSVDVKIWGLRRPLQDLGLDLDQPLGDRRVWRAECQPLKMANEEMIILPRAGRAPLRLGYANRGGVPSLTDVEADDRAHGSSLGSSCTAKPKAVTRSVVGADPEGPVAVVGVLGDADLVVEELAGESLGFGGPREVKPPVLEEHLETGDQPGLAELDHASLLSFPPVSVGEVDGDHVRGLDAQEVDDRLTDPGRIDEDGGPFGRFRLSPKAPLRQPLGDLGVGRAERKAFEVAD